MKYLVTGGAGFIGSHITEYLINRGDSVAVIDNFNTGKEKNLESVMDKIEFFKAGYDTIMLEYQKYNLFNSTSWNFPIETGNVILFPSHLVHGVNNKKGTNLRISLAFNVFLRGHIGSDEKIMQLKLK